MENTPKSLRLQIALFGRTNVGKSSFLNLISGQDVAITSPVPGTTTDVVEKTMELLPLGPVVSLIPRESTMLPNSVRNASNAACACSTGRISQWFSAKQNAGGLRKKRFSRKRKNIRFLWLQS